MRVLVTGGNGQLGQQLVASLTAAGHRVVAPLSQELNIGEPGCVARLIAYAPQLVIHSAAYTNVDGCARDPHIAQRINTLGTQYVALACQALDIPLVYISTNEVFAGDAEQPYFEYDAAQPINAYGRSKWGGEQAVRALLPRHYICRVAWLYGGPRSFVRTVLRLGAQQNELRMVSDEVGSPTYAADAADAITQLIAQRYYGTYHIVNAGQTSRYAFAEEVLRQHGQTSVRLQPIKLAEFVRASTPPPFTPLENIAAAALGIVLRPWDEALAAYLATADASSAPSTT